MLLAGDEYFFLASNSLQKIVFIFEEMKLKISRLSLSFSLCCCCHLLQKDFIKLLQCLQGVSHPDLAPYSLLL